MPRNTIQKVFNETEVHGFMVDEGRPVAVSFTLPYKCESVKKAQTFVRRSYPSFACTGLEVHSRLYKMTYEDFKKYATIVQDTEEQENENE